MTNTIDKEYDGQTPITQAIYDELMTPEEQHKMQPKIWFDGESWCVKLNQQLHTGIRSLSVMKTLWPFILEWS